MFFSRRFFYAAVAAILSGVAAACGFPGLSFPTASFSFLLPFALVPLFVALETLPLGTTVTGRGRRGSRAQVTPFLRGRQAFFLCWIFGSALASVAFFWCTTPAILFGNIPAPLAYLGFAGYCLLSGGFFAVVLFPFSWNVGRTTRRGVRFFPLLAMILVSTALEHWLPRFFFWTLGSLLHRYDALNQWSSVFGFSAGTAFILFSNAALARSITSQPKSPGRVVLTTLGVAAFWAVLFGLGQLRIDLLSPKIEALPKTRIGVIQPNFSFSELSSNQQRPADAQEQSLDVLLHMTEELVQKAGSTPLDLVVWPESVAPSDFSWSKVQLDATKALSAKLRVPILAQAIEFDEEELKEKGFRQATMYSNSFLLRPDGSRSPSFRKWIPIPFGESVPFEKHFPWLGEIMRQNVGNTSKVGVGTRYEALPYTPTDFVAPLICFDSIEPELPRIQTLQGNATVFVNQANFVWMGLSNAGYEFREIDRFRAIENGRSLILAANTGPSAAFDPLGRLVGPQTGLMTQASLIFEVPVNTEITFYTRYGNLPLAIAALLSAAVLLYFAVPGNSSSSRR